MKRNAFTLLLLIISCSLPAYGQLPDSLAAIFSYQRTKLTYKADSSFRRGNILTERVTYQGADSFLVSAFIIQPIKKTKVPLVIFQHWGEGDKTEFLEEAIDLARKGFICILPDGPWLCPNTPIRSFKRQGFEMYRQCVMNVRAAIDLAEDNFTVDPKKIFFTGHSFGCNTGAILSAVDPRIDFFIFMTGASSTTQNVANSKQPDFIEWRTSEPEQFKAWLVRMRPLDADLYLPYKTKPCLIQVANKDEFIDPQENDRFIATTPLPKTVKRYEAAHILNQQARMDRMRWILDRR